jgi:two-component system CheB/CheR fusion protein
MGASAGGLEAFTRFFQAMPPDSGMAFVLIQHLDPTHESLTAELLGKHTKMPVRQVAGDVPVLANQVYVIPPNKYLSISKGILRLTPPQVERRAMRMPIDFFFRSLAEDQQERGIGILLSGTGTDGTLGLKEIKMVGGMAIAQDPRTIQHGGMPQSAIANDAVDHVLPVGKMPETLLKYAQHPYLAVGEATADTGADDLTRILALVRARLRFDFSGYKKGTLLRRVRRRMGLRHVEGMLDYLRLLRGDPDELKALFKDLLIGVTRFFRDPPAWQFLEEKVLPALVRERDPAAPLRLWVAGCGTGEEAYSLGMALIEQVQATQRGNPIQIFASDVDEEGLDFARAGVYPESIAADVPAGRLSRFFLKGENSYRVSKELRECVVFARQNLIADAPFSRLDLISCRNLLIYLEPDVQKRVVSLFHFALVDGGRLFLGSAESVGPAEDLFDTVSKKWRVYRRIGPTRHDRVIMPVMAQTEHLPLQAAPILPATANHLLARVQRILLDRFAPASVVINRRSEILFFSGPVDQFLTQPPGPPTHDLIARLREGLQSRLRSMVHRAVSEGRPQSESGARVRRDSTWHRVRVTVEPIKLSTEHDGLLMVSFADEEADRPPTADAGPATPPEGDEDSVVRQLEDELRTSREDLQSTIEELETSNEELRAANEEVMSVNEELQSTNEELETSKEELQSLNEELSTVNAQLQTKVEELERANNDLNNLLTSTNIATVFLDPLLRIRLFTPAATRLFTLIPSDIGRPLADIAQQFTDPALLADAQAVLDRLTPRQAEVQAAEGRRYVRQILPYRTQDGRIDGVVLTFSDVAADALHAARSGQETALRNLQAVLDTAASAIITIDERGTVLSFNHAAERLFGYPASEVIGGNVRMLMPAPYRQEHDGYLRRYRETGVPRIIGTGPRELEGCRKDGTTFPMDLAVSEFRDDAERKFTAIIRDLSERKEAEQRAREHQAELARVLRVRTAGELGASLAHQLNQPLTVIANDLDACRTHLRGGRIMTSRRLLAHASAEAMRAAAVVRSFGDMFRKTPPRFELIDVRDIVRATADLARPEMTGAKVVFHVELPPESLPVQADRIQLEQVVLNLLQNALEAVRAVPAKQRSVWVRALRVGVTRGASGEAKVMVEDTGPGIRREVAARIFEPFFTTKEDGLGMGLTIAGSIVEMHHGRLWIDQRRGRRGGGVSFTLPLYDRSRKERRHDSARHRLRGRR